MSGLTQSSPHKPASQATENAREDQDESLAAKVHSSKMDAMKNCSLPILAGLAGEGKCLVFCGCVVVFSVCLVCFVCLVCLYVCVSACVSWCISNCVASQWETLREMEHAPSVTKFESNANTILSGLLLKSNILCLHLPGTREWSDTNRIPECQIETAVQRLRPLNDLGTWNNHIVTRLTDRQTFLPPSLSEHRDRLCV